MPPSARSGKSPKRSPSDAPQTKDKASPQGKKSGKYKARPSAFRLSLSAVAFVLLVLANLGQHAWHPPLSLCEAQAAKEYGGPNWRDKFDPFALTDGVKLWTPAHEARLQDYSGKAVYLTCLTIFGQATYQGLSLLAEIVGVEAAPRLSRSVYASASFVNGFGILVCCMWLFFWFLQAFFHPEWRAQWDFFESRGYAYMPLMCLVHLPSLFCGLIDIASKDPRLLAKHCPSDFSLIKAVTTYHAAFELWLLTNYHKCSGAIPYPWYYEIKLSPYPLPLLTVYLLGVNVMISAIVLGYRRYILWWVSARLFERHSAPRTRRVRTSHGTSTSGSTAGWRFG
jgi:hypothetical protein